jgi:hypothetical protein
MSLVKMKETSCHSMSSPDLSGSLVFDASVTINFLGTGIAGRLLPALGRPILMADRTFAEIRRHPLRDCDHVAELESLRRSGVLDVQTLSPEAKDLFFTLAGGDLFGGLDDGEAAAIALSLTVGHPTVLVIDDRKARTVLSARWPNQKMQYTADLFSKELAAIPAPELADAAYSALIHARMRVPQDNRAFMEDLVGAERARNCPSIGSRA